MYEFTINDIREELEEMGYAELLQDSQTLEDMRRGDFLVVVQVDVQKCRECAARRRVAWITASSRRSTSQRMPFRRHLRFLPLSQVSYILKHPSFSFTES